MEPFSSEPSERAEPVQGVCRDHGLRVELPQPVGRRRRVAHHHLVVTGHNGAKLPPDERLRQTATDDIVDGSS